MLAWTCVDIRKQMLANSVHNTPYSFLAIYITIEGYNFCRLDRDLSLPGAKTCGGGVVTYIANDIAYIEKKDKNICNINMEVQYIILNKANCKTLHLFNIYRPPDGNIDTFFKMLTTLMTDLTVVPGKEFFLMGDFNINVNKKYGDHDRLKNFMTTFALIQLIKDFTHKNPVGENTIIDLILTPSTFIRRFPQNSNRSLPHICH